MNEIQLRVLVWDLCCNDDKLRDSLKTADIYRLQDLAVEMSKKSEIYPLQEDK